MFGLGKKHTNPRPNHIFNKITREIESEFESEQQISRPPKEVYNFYYTDGRINPSVPNEYLAALPMHFRRHWPYLDWELCFPQIEEEVLDIPELSEDSKNMIKAVTFGELKSKEEVD